MGTLHYSPTVMDHFRNPRNVGSLEGENVAVGRVGNPVCGDLMDIYIEVENERIVDIKFKTFGCGSAIATSSMITEMVKGKTLDEAMKVSRKDVATELDGLPPIKMHCSNLAADALHEAIKNYRKMQVQQPEKAQKEIPPEKKEIIGEQKFLNHGAYHRVDDTSQFKDKRVIVLDRGNKSIELAIALTSQTGRVVFLTSSKDISAPYDVKTELKRSDVKVLYESELLEIKGSEDVEKVRVLDKNEDEQYELSVDSVIIVN